MTFWKTMTATGAFAITLVATILSCSDDPGRTHIPTICPVVSAMPAWSPDGSTIVYFRPSFEGGTLWTMNADGSAKTPVPGWQEPADAAATPQTGSGRLSPLLQW